MENGGAKTKYVKIMFNDEDHRSVHAAVNIKRGEVVLFVPFSQLVIIE